MGVRTVVVAAMVAAVLTFPMAGVAAAQDRDCDDFTTQAQAQAVYEANRTDPNALDLDRDGVACETRPGGAVGSAEGSITATGTAPVGGVETGAGGTADLAAGARDTADASRLLLPLGLMGGAVLAAGGLVLLHRRSPRSDRRER